jgi:hypothetical protein
MLKVGKGKGNGWSRHAKNSGSVFPEEQQPAMHVMTSDEVKEFCAINGVCESILELAIKRMNLSARSFFRNP